MKVPGYQILVKEKNHQQWTFLMFGLFGSNSTITKGVISDVPKCQSLTLPKNENIRKNQKINFKRKGAKRQPICMAKPAYNFFNHTFTSFSSTGQKVLQTCPSLTKLSPKCKKTCKLNRRYCESGNMNLRCQWKGEGYARRDP